MNHTNFIDYLERKQSEYLEKHHADFIKELFEDEEFLNVNVISHFSRNETEFFGLTLLDVSEPCEHCGDVHSDWWGIIINTTEKYCKRFKTRRIAFCHSFC